jgi:hypothetical protein
LPDYDYRSKKIVVALAAHLEPGVAINIATHLSISLGAQCDPNLMGREMLVDMTGTEHLGMARYPAVITRVKQARLRRLLQDARQRADLIAVDFPEQMLASEHDDDLAADMARTPEEEFLYLGVLIYGDAEVVTDLTGRFMLWN